MAWGQRLLAAVMWANPLTYGVAALRRLIYSAADSVAIPADTPSLAVSLLVTCGFAVLMLAVAWKMAEQRTTGDLL